MKTGSMEYRCPSELSFTGNIGQNWKDWYQQFKMYLIESNKEKEDDVCQINMLLNVIGPYGVKINNNFWRNSKVLMVLLKHLNNTVY